jgi:hypothetical protein
MSDIFAKSQEGYPRKQKDMGTHLSSTVVDDSGRAGVVVRTSTTTATGSFNAIQVLADATFSLLTESGATGDTMTGFVVPAGVTLFGNFTAFTLTSGKVRAYL